MLCSERSYKHILDVSRVRSHSVLLSARSDGKQGSCSLQPLKQVLSPASKVAALSINRVPTKSEIGISKLETVQKWDPISKALTPRKQLRRSRWGINTRYWTACFLNRGDKGNRLISMSLQSGVDTTAVWRSCLMALSAMGSIAKELVTIGMQLMENPVISEIEYHQGTRTAYEMEESFIKKCGGHGVYIDARDVALNLEHTVSKSLGGSNCATNLSISFGSYNKVSGTAQGRRSSVDSTVKFIRALKPKGITIEIDPGTQIKVEHANIRIQMIYPLDAVHIGAVNQIKYKSKLTLNTKFSERGVCKRSRFNNYECFVGYLAGKKFSHRLQARDIVKVVVDKGVETRTYIEWIANRTLGNFRIQTKVGEIPDNSNKYCRLERTGPEHRYLLNDDSKRASEGQAKRLSRYPSPACNVG